LKYGIFVALILLGIVPAACDRQGEDAPIHAAAPEATRISGSISYRERMALTDQAVVEITLQDVSLADAPSIIIAKQRISNPGQVPIKFELEYPAEDIDVRRTYSLGVRISDRDQLMFINDTRVPVLTRGAGKEVNIALVRVQNTAPDETGLSEESSGMVLEGMFRYMADSALFRDCSSNLVFPVAMEAQYIELERAYLNSGIEPGMELYSRLIGRYLERQDFDEKINKTMLIVDEVKETSNDKSCAPQVHAELENTYWKLVELGGEMVHTPEGAREVHLTLATTDSRVQGFAGCNNFFGSYQADGDALTFSAMGITMMACPEGMDTEQTFMQALGETTRAEIAGQVMKFYADDRLLATFEAVYL